MFFSFAQQNGNPQIQSSNRTVTVRNDIRPLHWLGFKSIFQAVEKLSFAFFGLDATGRAVWLDDYRYRQAWQRAWSAVHRSCATAAKTLLVRGRGFSPTNDGRTRAQAAHATGSQPATPRKHLYKSVEILWFIHHSVLVFSAVQIRFILTIFWCDFSCLSGAEAVWCLEKIVKKWPSR